MIRINRRRYCYDKKFRLSESRLITREINGSCLNRAISNFISRINSSFILLNSSLIVVEPNNIDMFGKLHSDGHTNVAKSDKC